jgi:predicted AlkP superfamily pyrophosphatase or phosphodiesterase
MKLLVVQCAALGHDAWRRHARADFWASLGPERVRTVFPAVTCTVQASFRTALPPGAHGMVANGFIDKCLHRAMFWEQSSDLYEGERIWAEFRRCGGTVGQVCWQQSLGLDADLVLSPAPIHKHHGGMIQDCYSRPGDLYRRLCAKLGKSFNLRDYWGPLTSLRATDWIAAATMELLTSGEAPDLLLTYLPHLDYEFQRNGPEGPRAAAVFAELEVRLERLVAAARASGYEILVWGDYAITPAVRPVYPNRVLREAGWLAVRDIRGRLYPDLHATPAFALVDHQVAYVHLRDVAALPAVLAVLQGVPGIARVMTAAEAGIDHPRAGELVLVAAPGAWFAYPWWERPAQAPDFAGHVDIHNKPGFDPCELFFAAWPPFSVSQDAARIRGTHGLADAPEHDVVWASTLPDLQTQTGETVLDGASRLHRLLVSAAHERPQ